MNGVETNATAASLSWLEQELQREVIEDDELLVLLARAETEGQSEAAWTLIEVWLSERYLYERILSVLRAARLRRVEVPAHALLNWLEEAPTETELLRLAGLAIPAAKVSPQFALLARRVLARRGNLALQQLLMAEISHAAPVTNAIDVSEAITAVLGLFTNGQSSAAVELLRTLTRYLLDSGLEKDLQPESVKLLRVAKELASSLPLSEPVAGPIARAMLSGKPESAGPELVEFTKRHGSLAKDLEDKFRRDCPLLAQLFNPHLSFWSFGERLIVVLVAAFIGLVFWFFGEDAATKLALVIMVLFRATRTKVALKGP